MPRIIVLLAGLLLAGAAYANDPEQRIREALTRLVPGAVIDSVTPSPIDGYYEAVVSGQIIYVSGDGRYLIQGTLFDIENRIDLTDARRGVMRQQILEALPPERRMIFGPADARHHLVVFTDIDCGYCRRLHQHMDEYNALGITIEYLLYPRAGIGSHSYDKAVSVWCAADPHDAMTKAKDGIDPPPRTCDNPVAEHMEIGRHVGVTGTPALVTRNGQLLPGYMPPAQLLERLEALAQAARKP